MTTLSKNRPGKPKLKKKRSSSDEREKVIALVQETFVENETVKGINKSLKENKETIKNYMAENTDLLRTDTKDFGTIEAKYTPSVSRDMNNKKVIEIITGLSEEAPDEETMEKILDIIEYTPTINTEKLDALIYDGTIIASKLKPALEEKTTYKLTLKQVKGK